MIDSSPAKESAAGLERARLLMESRYRLALLNADFAAVDASRRELEVKATAFDIIAAMRRK